MRNVSCALVVLALVSVTAPSSQAEPGERPRARHHADDRGHHATQHTHRKSAKPGHGMAHWSAPPEEAARPNPVRPNGRSIARGRSIYASNCAACHGATGRGDGPAARAMSPKPADLATMAPRHPDGDLAWKIAEGRGVMPAWKSALSEVEIWHVVNYLKSMSP